MNIKSLRHILWFLLLVFPLFSCSGASSDSGGGIGGSGIISRGVLSGYGSVVVNGEHFDTRNAVIIVNGTQVGIGDTSAVDHLDIGKVVTVIGAQEKDNEYTAESVTYDQVLEGPILSTGETIHGVKEIVVMGQTVLLNSLTNFKNTTFETIIENDVVEISGFYDGTGNVWATFVEKTSAFVPNLVYEVNGFVLNLSTDQQTFQVNNLMVDYSFAEMASLPGSLPAEGLLVEVEGSIDNTGLFLTADRIEPADEVGAADSDEVEVMGFITRFVSISEFILGNQVVIVEDDALFVDGISTDIALGIKLEAEGTLIDGVLWAEEIEFWAPDQIEIEGMVTDFVSAEEFSVIGQVVHTDLDTVLENIELEEIEMGIELEIKGRLVDGILYADKVSFEID